MPGFPVVCRTGRLSGCMIDDGLCDLVNVALVDFVPSTFDPVQPRVSDDLCEGLPVLYGKQRIGCAVDRKDRQLDIGGLKPRRPFLAHEREMVRSTGK